eukprot:10953152-Heterocapsa_arctica.AAC.1
MDKKVKEKRTEMDKKFKRKEKEDHKADKKEDKVKEAEEEDLCWANKRLAEKRNKLKEEANNVHEKEDKK